MTELSDMKRFLLEMNQTMFETDSNEVMITGVLYFSTQRLGLKIRFVVGNDFHMKPIMK